MKKNKIDIFRKKFKNKNTVGGWLQLSDPNSAKIISNSKNLDWICLDMEHGLINLSWSHQKILNFIRAQTKPYPGAFLLSKKTEKKIIIWDCRMHSMDHEEEMGTVIEVAGEWGICCSNGVLTPLLVNMMDWIPFSILHYIYDLKNNYS